MCHNFSATYSPVIIYHTPLNIYRCLALLLLISLSASIDLLAQQEQATPRKAWVTSQIHGTPEPPLPYTFEKVFTQLNFANALEMVSVDKRLYVAERGGKIWSFLEQNDAKKADLLIDLKALHPELSSAYGIAFHPQWKTNKEVYITYTLGNGVKDGSRLSRFQLRESNVPELDPESEEILFTWISGGHNGAHLRFGPDGMLYISTGDGDAPSPPDKFNTGQSIDNLLCSILRIDVDHREKGKAYAIPKDNPFVTVKNARPEVWAFGFRNPWKMHFDEKGRLWCGDVGWELWETIHLVTKGSNAGWSAVEASQPIKPELASPLSPITPPVIAHPHTEAASITGGPVYRGPRLPGLRDAYIYGDFTTGKIWALWHDGQKITNHLEIADTPHKIVTFGEGQNGSLYYIDYASPTGIYRLIPNPKAGKIANFPRKLSATGLFTNTAEQSPAPGVYEYQIIEAMWQDGAQSQRFVALPDNSQITTKVNFKKDKTVKNSKVTWPAETVLVKTISTGKTSSHKIETQILHYDGESWNGYSYRWNDAGDDADLVEAKGKQVEVPSKGWSGGTSYRIHSRSECSRCHNSWNKFVLGFQPWQLKSFPSVKSKTAQEAAVELALTDDNFFIRNQHGLLSSSHGEASIEARSRSWLHTNCSSCHRRHGGGSAPLEVNFDLALADTDMINVLPTRGNFGLDQAHIITPGQAWNSSLLYRINAIGSAHMPLIGPSEVDVNASQLLSQWINQLPTENSSPLQNDSFTDEKIAQLLTSSSGAMKLVIAIDSKKISSEKITSIVQTGINSSNANISALFLRFVSPSQRPKTIEADINASALLKLKGDAAKGAHILSLTGKWAACFACHSINGSGGKIGPDLSKIGSKLKKSQILDSLLNPSKEIAPEFQTWQVETSEGETKSGFLSGQTNTEITLRSIDGKMETISKDKIKKQQVLTASLMPPKLLQALTEQEAADVLAWLSSLK